MTRDARREPVLADAQGTSGGRDTTSFHVEGDAKKVAFGECAEPRRGGIPLPIERALGEHLDGAAQTFRRGILARFGERHAGRRRMGRGMRERIGVSPAARVPGPQLECRTPAPSLSKSAG
jgi:hypothetical protein